MKNKHQTTVLAILLSFCLLLPGTMIGCGGKGEEASSDSSQKTRKTRASRSKASKEDDIAEQAKETKAKSTLIAKSDKGVQTLDQQLGLDEVYNPVGRRDPFQSFIDRAGFEIEEEPNEDVVDFTGAVLTKFQLRQLSLVGVIMGINGENIALVEDPTGKGYMVKVGTRISQGKISEINLNEVVVIEKYKNFLGETKVKENYLKLKKSGEGE